MLLFSKKIKGPLLPGLPSYFPLPPSKICISLCVNCMLWCAVSVSQSCFLHLAVSDVFFSNLPFSSFGWDRGNFSWLAKKIRHLAGKCYFRQMAEIFSSKSSPTLLLPPPLRSTFYLPFFSDFTPRGKETSSFFKARTVPRWAFGSAIPNGLRLLCHRQSSQGLPAFNSPAILQAASKLTRLEKTFLGPKFFIVS